MDGKIFISGGACSGKSTLARALAEKIGCATTSFGDILRRYSVREGLAVDRPTLQALGAGLIAKLNYDGFLQWIVAHSVELPWDGTFVLEGIRHEKMCEALKAAYPKSVLIHCDVDRETQVRRMLSRESMMMAKVEEILGHELEQAIEPMKAVADLVVVETTPLAETLAGVKALLGSR